MRAKWLWQLSLAVAWTALVFARGRADAPAGHYEISDSTVKDTGTGLTWQRTASSGLITWADARSYCEGLALAGGGWRLPALKELLTLVDTSRNGPAIDNTAFPTTPLERFWSASPSVEMSGHSWYINFTSGYSDFYTDTSSKYYARCVR